MRKADLMTAEYRKPQEGDFWLANNGVLIMAWKPGQTPPSYLRDGCRLIMRPVHISRTNEVGVYET